MLAVLLILTIPVCVVALLTARHEYRIHGKLTPWGLFLICAMLFLPNLMLEYATGYAWPSTSLDYFGAVVCVVGLAILLLGMFPFRSTKKVLCLDAGELTVSGLYRWSRNPQYLGWVLFLLGFALNDWSAWCLVALVIVATSLHFLVLIEEEHLARIFGQRFLDFCARTPRYLGRSADFRESPG